MVNRRGQEPRQPLHFCIRAPSPPDPLFRGCLALGRPLLSRTLAGRGCRGRAVQGQGAAAVRAEREAGKRAAFPTSPRGSGQPAACLVRCAGCCSEAGQAGRNPHRRQGPASGPHASSTLSRPGWGGGSCCHNGNHARLTGDTFVLQSPLARRPGHAPWPPALSSSCPCGCQSVVHSARCSRSPVSDLCLLLFSVGGHVLAAHGPDGLRRWTHFVWAFGSGDPSFPSGALPVKLRGPGVFLNMGGRSAPEGGLLAMWISLQWGPCCPTSQSPATSATSQPPAGRTPAAQPCDLWASPGSAQENSQRILYGHGAADGSWSRPSFCLSSLIC